MAIYGEGFLKRTGKSLSILAFETTKQSRILRRRMRISALQKEVKADLRDLGSLAYEAIIGARPALLEDEEARGLISRITKNKHEIERLREAIDRIGRAHKAFDKGAAEPPAPKGKKNYPSPDDEPASEPGAEGAPEPGEETPSPETTTPPPEPAKEKPAKKRGGFLRKKKKE
jgi:hypothetical protein